VTTCLEPRAPLEGGDDRLLGGAREHRAADDDGVPALAVRKSGPDVLAHALDGVEVDRPLRAGGRSDADEREVRCLDRLGRIRGAAPSTCRGRLGDRLWQARLEDRCLTVVDGRDFARVDVYSDDLMAAPREAARRNGAHVAQPEDSDSHEAPWPTD